MARAVLVTILLCLPAFAGDPAEKEALKREVEKVAAEVRDSPLPMAPFSVPRASFFYAALDVPPLESAETLAPGSLYLRLRTTHARSYKQQPEDGILSKFEGIYHEWFALDGSWGVARDWEVGMWLPLAGWDETEDVFHLFDDSGNAIVRNEADQISGAEASRRHDNFSVLGLRAKRMLSHDAEDGYDLAASVQLKIPIGRPRDLTNAGTWDAVLTMLMTMPRTWGTIHLNFGATFPIGNQDIFVPDADVTLDWFVHGGAAVTVPVSEQLTLGLQVEANSTAFDDVRFLRGVPVTAVVGARWMEGKYVFEVGGGMGLDWGTSYQWLGFLSFGRVF